MELHFVIHLKCLNDENPISTSAVPILGVYGRTCLYTRTAVINKNCVHTLFYGNVPY